MYKNSDSDYLKLKKKFDHLIESDQFMDLTLTYDYEEIEPVQAVNKTLT